jgi:hypothetical protein
MTEFEGDEWLWMATSVVSKSKQMGLGDSMVLLDLHPQLAAWALTARWRAEELVDSLLRSISDWSIVVAAALARSLLEGVLSFVGEAREITRVWAEIKREGPPSAKTAYNLREADDEPLTQAFLASRADVTEMRDPNLKRRNVLTLMQRGAKAVGLDWSAVERIYAQLSDAAHPSYGSQKTYVVDWYRDPGQHEMIVEIGRHDRGYAHVERRAEQRPQVALAAADALHLAVGLFSFFWPAFIATVDDFGLTTGGPFRTTLEYWRCHALPKPNDRCPCGSDLKWKRCMHNWGDSLPVRAAFLLEDYSAR